MDNVIIQEPLGGSDHDQRQFKIRIHSNKTRYNQRRKRIRKSNYNEISILDRMTWYVTGQFDDMQTEGLGY